MKSASTAFERLPTKGSVRVLLYLIAALAIANLVNISVGKPFWPVTRHIDLGSDDNAAAWFSSVLLLLAALAAFDCYLKARAEGLRQDWVFLVLAGLMTLMSCDEVARFHETIFADLGKLLGVLDMEFAKHAGWVWVGGPLIGLTFALIAWLSWNVLMLVPDGAIRFAAGLGLMILGGVILESSINFLNQDSLKWVWDLEIVVEETLEMLGSLLCLDAFRRWRDTDIRPELAVDEG